MPVSLPPFESELFRRNVGIYMPHATLPVIRSVGGGCAHTANAPTWAISDDPGGAINRFKEVGESGSVPFPSLLSAVPHKLSFFWDAEALAGPGFDAWADVGFGSINAGPPFPSAPSSPCARVKWRAGTGEVVLYTCKGDGVNTAAEVLSSNVFLNASARYELLVEPGVSVQLYEGGQLIAEQRAASKLPDFSLAHPCRFGMSVFTGTLGVTGITNWVGGPVVLQPIGL